MSLGQEDDPPPLANGTLCLSTPKHNDKSGTECFSEPALTPAKCVGVVQSGHLIKM